MHGTHMYHRFVDQILLQLQALKLYGNSHYLLYIGADSVLGGRSVRLFIVCSDILNLLNAENIHFLHALIICMCQRSLVPITVITWFDTYYLSLTYFTLISPQKWGFLFSFSYQRPQFDP